MLVEPFAAASSVSSGWSSRSRLSRVPHERPATDTCPRRRLNPPTTLVEQTSSCRSSRADGWRQSGWRRSAPAVLDPNEWRNDPTARAKYMLLQHRNSHHMKRLVCPPRYKCTSRRRINCGGHTCSHMQQLALSRLHRCAQLQYHR